MQLSFVPDFLGCNHSTQSWLAPNPHVFSSKNKGPWAFGLQTNQAVRFRVKESNSFFAQGLVDPNHRNSLPSSLSAFFPDFVR